MADGTVSLPHGQGGSFRVARLHYSVKDSNKQRSPVVKDELTDELAGLELTERAKVEAEHNKWLSELRRMFAQESKEQEFGLQLELRHRLLDFDPKQGGEYYTRFYFTDLRKFDLDEESPLGPMRFTNAVYVDERDYQLCGGFNIFSVKISCSDVGFPIHVYGTVIARDSIDDKCNYIFRRDRDHCQIINSEDESLTLVGPKRGLSLISYNYIETDLKIKDHEGADRELSKGFLEIKCASRRSLEKCVVERESLATRLSTVDVIYGFLPHAVEGTIAIEVVEGYFDGQITAHTTSIQNRIVLYDRELYGGMTSDGIGVIQLARPAVTVSFSLKDMLVIVAKTRDGKSERTISFAPRVNGAEKDVIWVGGAKMHVKVTWSIIC